jgi:PAS domain-containing protein
LRFGGDGFEILERITEAFFVLDDEWHFIYVNLEAERVFFRSREKLLGKTVWRWIRGGRGWPIKACAAPVFATSST